MILNSVKHKKKSQIRLLYAKWLMEAKAKNAKEILAHLTEAEKATKGTKNEGKTHYLLGKYYDYLLSQKFPSGIKPSKLIRQIFCFCLQHYGAALVCFSNQLSVSTMKEI